MENPYDFDMHSDGFHGVQQGITNITTSWDLSLEASPIWVNCIGPRLTYERDGNDPSEHHLWDLQEFHKGGSDLRRNAEELWHMRHDLLSDGEFR